MISFATFCDRLYKCGFHISSHNERWTIWVEFHGDRGVEKGVRLNINQHIISPHLGRTSFPWVFADFFEATKSLACSMSNALSYYYQSWGHMRGPIMNIGWIFLSVAHSQKSCEVLSLYTNVFFYSFSLKLIVFPDIAFIIMWCIYLILLTVFYYQTPFSSR